MVNPLRISISVKRIMVGEHLLPFEQNVEKRTTTIAIRILGILAFWAVLPQDFPVVPAILHNSTESAISHWAISGELANTMATMTTEKEPDWF